MSQHTQAEWDTLVEAVRPFVPEGIPVTAKITFWTPAYKTVTGAPVTIDALHLTIRPDQPGAQVTPASLKEKP